MYRAQLETAWHNRVYFDPQRTPRHIESFWIKANDPERRRAIWLRFTIDAGAEQRRASVWAIWFAEDGDHFAIRQDYPVERLRRDPERAGIGVGESALDEGGSYGAARQGEVHVSWRFRFEEDAPPYLPYPGRFLYTNGIFPKKKLTIGHPSVRLRGTLEIWRGGRRAVIALDGWPGMQGHVWGKRHIERYVWVHCNAFRGIGAGTHLHIGAAQVRIGPFLTPVLSVARLYHGDRVFCFDALRRLAAHSVDFRPGYCKFRLIGDDAELHGVVRASVADTVGLAYVNPHGTTAYCLNSSIAELHAELHPSAGAPEKLDSAAAAIEVTQLDADHGMRMYR